jgi:DNA-binding beta-propeller fold protein YncE
MTIDRVQPLKFEDPATGGDETDQFPTALDPHEDHVELAGLVFDDATHRDETTRVWRDGDDLRLKDVNNSDAPTLTDLRAGGGDAPHPAFVVTCSYDNTISVIDVASKSLTIANARVGAGGSVIQFGETNFLLLESANNCAYVIDQYANEVGSPITVGTSPTDVAYGNGYYCVTNSYTNNVTIIDATTLAVVGSPIAVGTIPLCCTYGNGYFAIVNSSDDTVTIIDATTLTVVGSPIVLGSYTPDNASAIAYGNGYFVVTMASDATVSIIDATTLAIVGSPIAVGTTPLSIAYGNGHFAIGNYSSNNVTFLNATSLTVTATESYGVQPIRMAYNDGYFAVLSPTETLTIVDAATRVSATTISVPNATEISEGSVYSGCLLSNSRLYDDRVAWGLRNTTGMVVVETAGAPTATQVLTATSPTTAAWSDATATGLKSATTTVSVAAATAPTAGQVLKATSSTAAGWSDADVTATGLKTVSTTVAISASAAPIAGQVLKATSSTAAIWSAAIATGLQSATTNVLVSAAAEPTAGQVLTATSATVAVWSTPKTTGLMTFNIANANLINIDLITSTPTVGGLVIPTEAIDVKTLRCWVYTAGGAGNVQGGIYNATTNALIATTNSVSAASTGIKVLTFTTAVALSANTTYYLALTCTSSGSAFVGSSAVAGTFALTPKPAVRQNGSRFPATLTPAINTSLVWILASNGA